MLIIDGDTKYEHISLYLSRKLQKLGYEEKIHYYYNNQNQLVYAFDEKDWNSENNKWSAPTYDEVCTWFYDNYGVYINIRFELNNVNKPWGFVVMDTSDNIATYEEAILLLSVEDYMTKYDAAEVAIEDLIDLIENYSNDLEETSETNQSNASDELSPYDKFGMALWELTNNVTITKKNKQIKERN